MEKMILTKKQVEAIESIKDKDYAINILALLKRPDHPLATLEISQVAKLLYGLVEYEIEPEKPKFQPGDKVVTKKGNELVTLSNPLVNKPAWFLMDEYGKCRWIYTEDFHLATPEEIYWLETLGRKEVPDFRIGDAVLSNRGTVLRMTANHIIAETLRTYKENPEVIVGVFPEEAFKSLPPRIKECR